MDREHIKGAADKAKGTIKDAAGKVTGDKELRTEGKLERRKGPLTTLPAMSKTLCATHRKHPKTDKSLSVRLVPIDGLESDFVDVFGGIPTSPPCAGTLAR